MAHDAEMYKNLMAQWASGVTVVTTACDGQWQGLTVSSFTSVSLHPPMVLVCIGQELPARACIERSAAFAVNILSAEQLAWGLRFAGMLPDVKDRFEGITCTTAVTGSPILPDVLGWLDCRVYHVHPGGDHTIFVGEVLQGEALVPAGRPLLYYHRQWGDFAALPDAGA